jgi:hypothetical protein
MDIKQNLIEWKIASGAKIDSGEIIALSHVLESSVRQHKIPFDALQKIFEFCYSNYSKVNLPNFLKGWHEVQDAYWSERQKRNQKHEEEEKCPIPGMTMDHYLYFSECCLRRLGFKHMAGIGGAHRQIQLFNQHGLPEKVHPKETMVLEHHARGVAQGGGEWLMRQWSAVLARNRDERGLD